jgi:hypothetical protein
MPELLSINERGLFECQPLFPTLLYENAVGIIAGAYGRVASQGKGEAIGEVGDRRGCFNQTVGGGSQRGRTKRFKAHQSRRL